MIDLIFLFVWNFSGQQMTKRLDLSQVFQVIIVKLPQILRKLSVQLANSTFCNQGSKQNYVLPRNQLPNVSHRGAQVLKILLRQQVTLFYIFFLEQFEPCSILGSIDKVLKNVNKMDQYQCLQVKFIYHASLFFSKQIFLSLC